MLSMFFKRRAQSSAPIELLVAVIILIASMSLAFIVLQNTQNAQCTDKLRADLSSLKNAMFDVSIGSPSTSREANLELKNCGDLNVEAVRVVYYKNPAYCGKCTASGGGCWKIEPLSYNPDINDYRIVQEASSCINMPGRVEIISDNQCEELEDLVNRQDEGNAACPPDPRGENPRCDLAPGVLEDNPNHLLTLGKTPGETNYKVVISKQFGSAAGNPVIKMCFLSKTKAAEQQAAGVG